MDGAKLIEVIVGAALILFAVYSLFDTKRRASLTELWKDTAEAQRQRADDEAAARGREQVECQAKIAKLEARVDLLEGKWLNEVGAGLAEQVAKALKGN